jgi:hypothetical protein
MVGIFHYKPEIGLSNLKSEIAPTVTSLLLTLCQNDIELKLVSWKTCHK